VAATAVQKQPFPSAIGLLTRNLPYFLSLPLQRAIIRMFRFALLACNL